MEKLWRTYIRAATKEDYAAVRVIEFKSDQLFYSNGFSHLLNEKLLPKTFEELDEFRKPPRFWLVDQTQNPNIKGPLAFILLKPVDGNTHVEQVSVLPEFARNKLGKKLIEDAATSAKLQGIPALTLSTFINVPWNAPYYERLGFYKLTQNQLTEGLLQIQEKEMSVPITKVPRDVLTTRVFMRRDLL